MSEADLVDEYRAYLDRFQRLVGEADFGVPAKWNGRLVKKLSYEEFETRWQELRKFEQAYQDIVARGDTINDAVLKLLRDRSTELLLENASY